MEADLRPLDSASHLSLISSFPLAYGLVRSATLVHVLAGEVHVRWQQFGDSSAYVQDAEGPSDGAVDERFSMFSGDSFVANKGDLFEVTSNTEEPCLVFVFSISDSLLSQAIESSSFCFSCNSVRSGRDLSYDQLSDAIKDVLDAMCLEEERANFLLFSAVYRLLNELVIDFLVRLDSKSQDGRSGRALRYIKAHFREPISLSSVSAHFHLDPAYLSRMVKQDTGVNFKDHLMRARMECAERLLVTSDHGIAAIAAESGFTSLSSFNAACRKLLGETPSDYRRTHAPAMQDAYFNDGTEMGLYREIRSHASGPAAHNDTIRVDMQEDAGPFRPVWSELVNIGSVQDLRGDRIRRQLPMLREQALFRYARIWGFFTAESLCDLPRGTFINFDAVDEAIDGVLASKMLPWVVIGKCHHREHVYECDDISWLHAFTGFLEHVLDRYGAQELADWKFEFVFEGVLTGDALQMYFNRVKVSRDFIKSIDPDIQIGGAGFEFIDDKPLLDRCLSRVSPLLDFASLMCYPYAGSDVSLGYSERERRRLVEDGLLLSRVTAFRDTLGSCGVDMPIYVTEWSNTVSSRNLVSDTLYKGCHILKTCIQAYGHVEGMGYWLASDWYHAERRSGKLLSGGPGLITKDGIAKPSFTAFSFLAELGDKRLVKRGDDYVACTDGSSCHILCFNLVRPSQLYYVKEESGLTPQDIALLFNGEPRGFSFDVKNLENGQYQIRTYICDAQSGSVFDGWRAMGFSAHLRTTDLAYIRENARYRMEMEERDVVNGSCHIDRTVGLNEFLIVNLRKRSKIT